MKIGHLLGIVGWASIALGCSWSTPSHAQGKTDLLLPPSGSLPLGTGNQPPATKAASAAQPPGGIQQTSNTVPKVETTAATPAGCPR